MSNSDYVKEYWRGYHTCKDNIEYGGYEFAVYEYMYGLNGATDVYVRGYRACLYKSKPE